MTGIDTVTGRRNVMKRLGLLGAALPLAGLIGCTDQKQSATKATSTAAAAATAADFCWARDSLALARFRLAAIFFGFMVAGFPHSRRRAKRATWSTWTATRPS